MRYVFPLADGRFDGLMLDASGSALDGLDRVINPIPMANSLADYCRAMDLQDAESPATARLLRIAHAEGRLVAIVQTALPDPLGFARALLDAAQSQQTAQCPQSASQ